MTTILITGASSGLGRSLALAYADKGNVLFLMGRNPQRLQSVKEEIEKKGAVAYTKAADVRDPFEMEKIIKDAAMVKPLDIVIANAGVSANVLGRPENPQEIRTVFTTNVNGVLNTVLPAIEEMKKQKHGHIVLISSMAGYRFVPQGPAYSASKACIKSWGESLYYDLKKDGISVTTVCPGFIDTPLTKVNKFPMPFLMNPDKAARLIKNAVKRKKAFISFPQILVFFVWLRSIMPSCVLQATFNLFTKKYLEKKK